MAIVTCDHHSGMGLCEMCRREQDRYAAEDRHRKGNTLRQNEMLLKRAADVLSEAGEYHLATQIRNFVR